MLAMAVLGVLQTVFFALLLKNYLDLSWGVTLTTLLTVFVLLFSRVWYLVRDQKRSQQPHGL